MSRGLDHVQISDLLREDDRDEHSFEVHQATSSPVAANTETGARPKVRRHAEQTITGTTSPKSDIAGN